VFGFVPLGASGALRPLVERISREIARLDYSVTVLGVEAQTAPTEWFSEVETEPTISSSTSPRPPDAGWRNVVARQVDRLFRVGRGDRRPPHVDAVTELVSPLQAQNLVDLILVHPAETHAPRGSEDWMDLADPARIFHLRRDRLSDVERMARVLTGQSVGLVLSGGGARAYAHIGAGQGAARAWRPHRFRGRRLDGALSSRRRLPWAGRTRRWIAESMRRSSTRPRSTISPYRCSP
jgi:NTE family protein